MIEIIGPEEAPEYEVAQGIASKMVELWPELERDDRDVVRLYVCGKLFGYERRDFDVVLIARFSKPRRFRPSREFRPYQQPPIRPRQAFVRSLFLIFETKRHDSRAIKFDGLTASVRYRVGGKDTWENVSEQSHEQLWALSTYLKENDVKGVYVSNFIYFQNLEIGALPQGPHNFISGSQNFTDILNSIGEISRPYVKNGIGTISAGREDAVDALLNAPLFRKIEPTPLDRKRMDMIARKEAHRASWFDELGQKQIILRGRGGAGKTVLLLQMAYRAFQERGARSLFLTYNTALIADVRRTMAIFQIPNTLAHGGIRVDSVMSFTGKIMRRFGLISEEVDFLEEYKSIGRQFLEYCDSGTISDGDIDALKSKDGDDFAFDFVLIDEGQDWTREEVRTIRTMYAPEQIIVADGVDQFVRSEFADWQADVDRARVQTRNFRRCLRMKSNLARFCNSFADAVGLVNWSVQPNVEVGGGRVVVVEGRYDFENALHVDLMRHAAEANNKPVDLLVCAPPSAAKQEIGSEHSKLADQIMSLGGDVWDGLTVSGRKVFATNPEQLRLVQFDSCRGLEGWTVFLLGVDEFWDFKNWQLIDQGKVETDLFETPEKVAAMMSARWLMIAMTRAIDTLVINVSDPNHHVAKALRAAERANPDFIEWHLSED